MENICSNCNNPTGKLTIQIFGKSFCGFKCANDKKAPETIEKIKEKIIENCSIEQKIK